MKLKYIGLSLLLLLLLLAAGVVFLAATERGTRWFLSRVSQQIPGRFSIERVEGTLLGPLTLEGIDYRQNGTEVAIGRLSMRWRPRRLLSGELYLETLSMERVRYRQPPAEEETPAEEGAPPEIDFPLAVTVEQATVEGIVLLLGEQEIELDRVTLSMQTADERLQIQALRVEAPTFEVALEGSVLPQGDYPIDVSFHWSATPQEDLPLQGRGRLNGDLQTLQVTHQLSRPFQIETEGTVQPTRDPLEFDLRGGWSDLVWPLEEAPEIQSPGGMYQLTGQVDDYRFQLRADLEGPAFPSGRVEVEGSGGTEAIILDRLQIATLEGEIAGEGRLTWAPDLQWDLSIGGIDLNPGTRWPDWEGRISFQAGSQGSLTEGVPAGHVRVDDLSGRLRGYPVSGSLALDFQEERYHLERLLFRSGSASFQAEGALADGWDLAWRLDAPDLASLLPDAGGRLVANGRVEGPRTLPLIAARVRGRSLAAAEMRLKRVSLDLRVDLQDRIDSRIELAGEGLHAADQTIDRFSAQGTGRLSGHALRAEARLQNRQISLQMQGRLEEQRRWEGRLTRSAFQDPTFGRWVLLKPVPVSLSMESVRVEEGCWQREDARLCAAGAWQQTEGWRTEGRAEQLPIELLGPWLPTDIDLTGGVDAAWRAVQEDDRLQAEASVTPRPGTVTYRIDEDETMTVSYQEGLLRATLREETLQVEAALTLAGQGRFRAEARLSPVGLDRDWMESGVEGNVQAQLTQLGLVAAFTPMVENTEGRIEIDLSIGGTVNAPRITGAAVLDQGSATLPQLGIQISPLRLEVRSEGERVLNVRGEARSGPGTLQIEGTATLDAEQGWPARISIRGERVEVLDLPEVHLLATPNLLLQLQGRRIELTGELFLPEAQVRLRELPQGAVTVSEDAVIVAAPPDKMPADEEAPWEIHTRVMIRLGEEVRFEGFGLQAQISGRLSVTEAPARPTLGEGELRVVDGEYRAYGQQLDITDGRLLFAGPIDNPGLDLRAVRRIEAENITAGIHVGGTLNDPRTTLFSEPPMDEMEVLSYLLLGRPLSQATRGEGDLLVGAISALGIRGGNFLAKRIGSTLGLDEVRLETEDGIEDVTLVIGRYLSPRFYVSYGIGLFEEGNTLRLRYTLNRRLTLRAISGEESGLDLLYTREFD